MEIKFLRKNKKTKTLDCTFKSKLQSQRTTLKSDFKEMKLDDFEYKNKFLELENIDLFKNEYLPLENEILHIAIKKGGNLYSIIENTLNVESVSVAFATIGEKSVKTLNAINKTNIVLARNRNDFTPLSEISKDIVCVKFKMATIHFKMILIKTKDSYFVVNSSLNPKHCGINEIITIMNNEQKYFEFLNIFEKI